MAKLRAQILMTLVVFSALGGLSAQVQFQIRGESGEKDKPLVAGVNQIIRPTVYITNADGDQVPKIQGFQMAISHDADFLRAQISDVTWEGTSLDSPSLRTGEGPDFFLVREIYDGIVSQGMTLGVIFEDEAPSFVLDAGEWRVAVLSYLATKSTPDGTPTKIQFPEELGDPAIENKYNDLSTGLSSEPAETVSLDVQISGELKYTIAFQNARVNVKSGGEVDLSVYIENNPRQVDGFSFGVKHDAKLLELVDAKLGEGVTSILDGDPDDRFYMLDKNPENGTGFTVAIIFSHDDETKVLNPAQSPHQVIDIKYKAIGDEGTAKVEITDDLGTPPVAVIMDLFGNPQEHLPPLVNPPPTTVNVEIKSSGERFIRSDVNQSGNVNLTDAIGIIQYLFTDLAPPFHSTRDNCLIAFNVDGNKNTSNEEAKENIELADIIYLLSFLFKEGDQPAPPPPFLDNGRECDDFDGPATAEMICQDYNCPE